MTNNDFIIKLHIDSIETDYTQLKFQDQFNMEYFLKNITMYTNDSVKVHLRILENILKIPWYEKQDYYYLRKEVIIPKVKEQFDFQEQEGLLNFEEIEYYQITPYVLFKLLKLQKDKGYNSHQLLEQKMQLQDLFLKDSLYFQRFLLLQLIEEFYFTIKYDSQLQITDRLLDTLIFNTDLSYDNLIDNISRKIANQLQNQENQSSILKFYLNKLYTIITLHSIYSKIQQNIFLSYDISYFEQKDLTSQQKNQQNSFFQIYEKQDVKQQEEQFKQQLTILFYIPEIHFEKSKQIYQSIDVFFSSLQSQISLLYEQRIEDYQRKINYKNFNPIEYHLGRQKSFKTIDYIRLFQESLYVLKYNLWITYQDVLQQSENSEFKNSLQEWLQHESQQIYMFTKLISQITDINLQPIGILNRLQNNFNFTLYNTYSEKHDKSLQQLIFRYRNSKGMDKIVKVIVNSLKQRDPKLKFYSEEKEIQKSKQPHQYKSPTQQRKYSGLSTVKSLLPEKIISPYQDKNIFDFLRVYKEDFQTFDTEKYSQFSTQYNSKIHSDFSSVYQLGVWMVKTNVYLKYMENVTEIMDFEQQTSPLIEYLKQNIPIWIKLFVSQTETFVPRKIQGIFYNQFDTITFEHLKINDFGVIIRILDGIELNKLKVNDFGRIIHYMEDHTLIPQDYLFTFYQNYMNYDQTQHFNYIRTRYWDQMKWWDDQKHRFFNKVNVQSQNTILRILLDDTNIFKQQEHIFNWFQQIERIFSYYTIPDKVKTSYSDIYKYWSDFNHGTQNRIFVSYPNQLFKFLSNRSDFEDNEKIKINKYQFTLNYINGSKKFTNEFLKTLYQEVEQILGNNYLKQYIEHGVEWVIQGVKEWRNRHDRLSKFYPIEYIPPKEEVHLPLDEIQEPCQDYYYWGEQNWGYQYWNYYHCPDTQWKFRDLLVPDEKLYYKVGQDQEENLQPVEMVQIPSEKIPQPDEDFHDIKDLLIMNESIDRPEEYITDNLRIIYNNKERVQLEQPVNRQIYELIRQVEKVRNLIAQWQIREYYDQNQNKYIKEYNNNFNKQSFKIISEIQTIGKLNQYKVSGQNVLSVEKNENTNQESINIIQGTTQFNHYLEKLVVVENVDYQKYTGFCWGRPNQRWGFSDWRYSCIRYPYSERESKFQPEDYPIQGQQLFDQVLFRTQRFDRQQWGYSLWGYDEYEDFNV